MAINKNALIRYKTIDKCLQNHYRQWTLEDLIEACSDALYEYEDRDINVSKRTIQLDIQMMRGDKLGYNAPIEVYNKKYYRYADPDYSITNIPLNGTDLSVLSETVDVLRQFKDFSLFREVGGIIQRLEDKIYVEKTKRNPIIHLERNEQLKGLEHLEMLYQAILKKIPLKMKYQSFKARQAAVITLHPYLLKEYNNRWFVVGRTKEGRPPATFALDRIQEVHVDLHQPYIDEDLNGDEYYKNTVGVTVLGKEFIHQVVLKVDAANAPYVETKPLHPTQEIIQRFEDHSILLRMRVYLNFELERLILGFGNGIEVLEPRLLRSRIKKNLISAVELYQDKK